jgi:hypothetical protein
VVVAEVAPVTVDHPIFGTMCEICYHGLTVDDCAVDVNGDRWDVCAGECARQAGIKEAQDDIDVYEVRGGSAGDGVEDRP